MIIVHVTYFRWKLANDEGRFDAEMVPITIKTKKGPEEFKVDEHPKQTTLEKLAKLPPVFKKDGVVHAGNASVSINTAHCHFIRHRNMSCIYFIFYVLSSLTRKNSICLDITRPDIILFHLK